MVEEFQNDKVSIPEKRFTDRIDFNLEIFYPCINNVSVYRDFNVEGPLLKAVNLSKTGVCFIGKIPMKVGDFLSFMLKIEDNPTFWCLSEVKWVRNENDKYLVGCQFYLLDRERLKAIVDYTDKLGIFE
ncbi:MAG TPA: PilZ domain-containing protein [Clostridiaceae bacterium]